MVPSLSILALTVKAAATLTANRGVTALGAVPAAGASILGVTRTSAATGDPTPVDVLGTTEVEVGGTITAGGPLMVDNQGRFLDHTGANIKVAKALDVGSTVVGSTLEVLLIPNA